MKTTEFDFKATYTVEGYRGIAWYAWRYATIREPIEFEDGTVEDWEEIEDPSRVVCSMIGDDRKFEFPTEELTPIAREDYCSECGQIGCGGDAYPREES